MRGADTTGTSAVGGLRLILLTVAASAVLVSLAAAAFATPPGKNGRIVFTRYTDAERHSGALFTVAADGSGSRRLTRPGRNVVDVHPDWSADGSRVAFERQYTHKGHEVFMVEADGSRVRQLDPGCPPGIPATRICEAEGPAFSPNGRELAFAWAYGRLKQIRGEDIIETLGIAIMDTSARNVLQLTQLKRPTSAEDRQPVWSPDGRRIAFTRQNTSARPFDARAIFVIPARGGKPRQLTPWKLDAGDHPDWSPNGRRILFRAPANDGFVGSNLYTIGVDGRGLRKLTRFGPASGPLSASYSPDGRWVVFGRISVGKLPDLYRIRVDGTGLQRITRTAPWESAPDWGPTPRR